MSLKWFHKFHRVHTVKTEEKNPPQLGIREQTFYEIKTYKCWERSSWNEVLKQHKEQEGCRKKYLILISVFNPITWHSSNNFLLISTRVTQPEWVQDLYGGLVSGRRQIPHILDTNCFNFYIEAVTTETALSPFIYLYFKVLHWDWCGTKVRFVVCVQTCQINMILIQNTE